MKKCLDCKYADWERTAKGKLHPSGDGKCLYPYKIPALPQSMYWMGCDPRPMGGFINRKVEMKDHCVYYQERGVK